MSSDRKIGTKLLKLSVVILALLFSLMPFVNVLFPIGFMEDVFGFPDLTRFLYAIGQPVSMFLFAISMLYISNYSSKKIRDLIRLFTLPFIATSIFNIVWAFYYAPDLNKYVYYSTMMLVVILLTISIWFLFSFENSLRKKISDIVNYLFRYRNKTVYPLVKENDVNKRIEILDESEELFKKEISDVLD